MTGRLESSPTQLHKQLLNAGFGPDVVAGSRTKNKMQTLFIKNSPGEARARLSWPEKLNLEIVHVCSKRPCSSAEQQSYLKFIYLQTILKNINHDS